MKHTDLHIRAAGSGDRAALLDVWQRAVRATHGFLAEADVRELLPHVRAYLASADAGLWALCTPDDAPVGFMGLTAATIDSLFIAPEHARRGGGTRLLAFARARAAAPLQVDVNEQNPAALAFYLAAGFEPVGRSSTDDAGRPFPLLHLREIAHPPHSQPPAA